MNGSDFKLKGANMMAGKPMPRGWARAMEEEAGSGGSGTSKLVSPFLKGKRESKLNKDGEPETVTTASTIEARKKEDVKTGRRFNRKTFGLSFGLEN